MKALEKLSHCQKSKEIQNFQIMNQEQIIYRAGCWGCKKSLEDSQEKYICPKYQQHLREWKKQEFK